MMKKCYDNDNQGFPYVGGMKVDYTVDPATKVLTKVVLYGEDGKKLNLKKTYKVITNSYTVVSALLTVRTQVRVSVRLQPSW